MAHITLTGTLLTPAGKTAYRDQIRFTHKSTTGETVRSSVDLLTIIASGFYYVELEYGLVLIEYKSANDSQFKNLGVATVNGTNPSTSIPELLNGLVPVSSAELIQFQAILADAVTAKNESVIARNEAEAFANSIDLINDLSQAYIFDTVAEYKSSSIVFPVGKTIHLNDRDADFKVINGTGTATGFKIISSAVVNQSIDLDYDGVLKARAFGVVGDSAGTGNGADDTLAMAALILEKASARQYIDLENLKIRITSQLALNEIWVKADGAVILKDFDGTGVVITGGSYYFRLRGDLRVQGVGVGAADGTVVSTNGSANGVAVQGCRLDIDGKFESTNNQGNGFFINCNGNMNRSTIQQLHAFSNNSRGILFTGTQDDCAVWKISTYTFGNYEGGVSIDDTFQGRQWEWYCYNEASYNPSGLYGVYIGRLRSCKNISIYSEEQTLTGIEVQIGANCTDLEVFDMRRNRSANASVDTCSFVAGNGGLWSQQGISYESPSRGVGLTNDSSKFIAKKTFGSSSSLLMQEKIYGNSVYERQINARSNNVEIDRSIGQSLGDSYNHFGLGNPQSTTFKYEGVRTLPSDMSTGQLFASRHYGKVGGVVRELTRVEHELSDIYGNKGGSNIHFYTLNNDLSPIKHFSVLKTGDVELPRAGKGLKLTSPDGLVTKTISIDNSGNIVLS